MTVRLVAVIVTALVVAGCASSSKPRASTSQQPTTAQVAAANTITASDFDRLWRACADEARGRQFAIDRQDYRSGVLTTEPLVSAQFFEPWRRDAITADAVAESSLATIRRTIRFTFTRRDDGTFAAVPQVVVERYSSAERRLTSAMMYRNAFRRATATGSRELDRGVYLPPRYWYRTGNDPALEQDLAEAVRRRV